MEILNGNLNKRIIIIDGDSILFRVVPEKVLSETEKMYGVSNERTLEQICLDMDEYLLNKIFIPTQAEFYIGFLGGIGNFRKEISTEYKANRIDKEFPKYFKEVKQYLIDKWKFEVVDNIEAEDAVGIITSKEEFKVDLWDIIIVRTDHDLDQLPGIHFNFVKNEWKEISEWESSYNLYKQVLTGCTTDKVQGVPKIGEVKATKILADCTTLDDLKNTVINEYIKFYGDIEGLLQYEKNWNLIHILREKEDFIVPEIQSINQEVKVEDINNVEF